MFKKLLILSLVLLPLVGFAQESLVSILPVLPDSAAELTADTVATAPSLLDEILKALLVAFVSMLGFIGSKVLPLLNALLKTLMNFRGSGVVADATTQAFGELLIDIQERGADGHFCEEDRRFLKNRAKEIAEKKLRNLSGFYKKDLMGWLDEVLEVELGKLLSRIFGSRSSASEIR